MQAGLLNDKRRMWKYLIFGALTLGIYGIIFWWNMISDLNIAAGYVEDDDEDKSCNYIVLVLLSIVTLGIYMYIWWYKQGNRIKVDAERYGFRIEEKGSTYLLWNILGLWLFGVGPLVAIYLFMGNVNKLCKAYNARLQEQGGFDPGFQQNYQPVNQYGAGYKEPVPDRGYAGPTYAALPPQNAGLGYGEPMTADNVTVSSRKGIIECRSGEYAGARMEIAPNEELLVGRNGAICQLVLSDADISRKHMSIVFSQLDNCFYVTDYSSRGTIMNGSIRLPNGVKTKCPIGTKLSLANGNNVFILQ